MTLTPRKRVQPNRFLTSFGMTTQQICHSEAPLFGREESVVSADSRFLTSLGMTPSKFVIPKRRFWARGICCVGRQQIPHFVGNDNSFGCDNILRGSIGPVSLQVSPHFGAARFLPA